jgi:hypothetical protein
MAATALQPSSERRPIIEDWWFRFIVRALLALLAMWALAFAADRYEAYLGELRFNLTQQNRTRVWLAWLGPAVAAGLLFGLAAWLPFGKVRYLWSRLLLAGLALVPIAQYWWLFMYQLPRHGEVGGWIYRADWLLDDLSQTALAVLAGVAIASGLRTARSAPNQ